MKKTKMIVFDLDGTVLDTLPDLTDATNAVLTAKGFAARETDEVRRFVGNGVEKLMERAVPTGTSEDDTLKAIEDIKELAKTQCRVSGISATEDDIKNLLNSEMTIYVIVAVVLCIIVLQISLDSFIVPVFLLGSIGIAI